MNTNSQEKLLDKIILDYKSNFHINSPKAFTIVFFYRLASYFAQNRFWVIKFLGIPIRIIYRLLIEWILGVEIPDVVKSGGGLSVHHGVGLVLNPGVVLGKNIVLRHNTTIGHKTDKYGNSLGAPIIRDNVDVGANVVIIGNISIGENSIIGAGSVVVKDVPANCIVAGNPAKIIKYISE